MASAVDDAEVQELPAPRSLPGPFSISTVLTLDLSEIMGEPPQFSDTTALEDRSLLAQSCTSWTQASLIFLQDWEGFS